MTQPLETLGETTNKKRLLETAGEPIHAVFSFSYSPVEDRVECEDPVSESKTLVHSL